MDDLLTTVEAAQRLGCHRTHVWRLIQAGTLPATKHGRDWTIRAADLARVPPPAPDGRGWRRGVSRGRGSSDADLP